VSFCFIRIIRVHSRAKALKEVSPNTWFEGFNAGQLRLSAKGRREITRQVAKEPIPFAKGDRQYSRRAQRME
jgi:hypothetical protein